MYARVVTAMAKPEAFGRINTYRDNVLPIAKKLPGYKGTILLGNRELGKFLSIGLWETEEDMRSNEAKGFLRDQAARFATIVAAIPTSESFEVIHKVQL